MTDLGTLSITHTCYILLKHFDTSSYKSLEFGQEARNFRLSIADTGTQLARYACLSLRADCATTSQENGGLLPQTAC